MLNHKAFSIFKKNITTMKYVWLLILVCFSCKSKMYSSLDLNEKQQQSRLFTKVKIIPIIEEETLNVRALEIVEDNNALVFLSSLGDLGVYNNEIEELIFPVEIETDSIKPNFRSLSARNSSGYGMSISSPAKLYKLNIDLEKSSIVYQENHEKAFYDSLEFWNDEIRLNDWFWNIEKGGWTDLERTRKGFVSGLNNETTEYLILGINHCISIIANDKPKISEPN